MSAKGRLAAILAVAFVVLIGAGVAVFVSLRPVEVPKVEAPPPVEPESEPESTPEASTKIVVKSIRGKVATKRGESWVVAVPGITLDEKDAIRTGAGAEATLAVGTDESRVVVKERSEVSVREVKSEIARVRLERGRLGADLKGKMVLRVESQGSDTVAEAKKGRFSVFNNGKGLVAVAAETAVVELKTPQGKKTLEAGKQVTIKANKELKTVDIPQAVFLNVNWSGKKTTRAKSMPVTGRANAGSEVRVNGRLAVLGADGTFTVEVALREGNNPIDVEATDTLGRKKRSRKKVTAFHKAPEVNADGKEMWK